MHVYDVIITEIVHQLAEAINRAIGCGQWVAIAFWFITLIVALVIKSLFNKLP